MKRDIDHYWTATQAEKAKPGWFTDFVGWCRAGERGAELPATD